MYKIDRAFFGASRVAVAALALLVIALAWSAPVQAQSPAEDQYGGPIAPSGPALAPAGVAVESEEGVSTDSDGTTASASDSRPVTSETVDVLPATGGVTLLFYAGVLAASSAGLVLLRRSDRGE